MAGEQTRPSAIVSRPDPLTTVADATVAELATEILARIDLRRRNPLVAEDGRILRELALAATAAEDVIYRHNRALYMVRGVFAITDAERLPDA